MIVALFLSAASSVVGLSAAIASSDEPIELVSKPAEGGKRAVRLDVPEGYSLSVAAEGLPRVRFFTPAPDGRLFVTGLHSLSDNRRGRVYVLDEANPLSGRFGKVTIWLDRLRNPNSVAFYSGDDGSHWLYLATTDELRRYRYVAGELGPSSEPEVLAKFPGYGLSYKYGGWHLTRSLAVGESDGAAALFVSVGSSCNFCEERDDEPERASVLSMPLPIGELTPFARGLRNAVGLHWFEGRLYATNMGADHLGPDRPQDHLTVVDRNGFYGWPYCYEHEGQSFPEDPRRQSFDRVVGVEAPSRWRRQPADCSEMKLAAASLPAHSAPLGLTRVPSDFADERLRDYFLVALHGPTVIDDVSKARKAGYRIVRVRPGGVPETVVGGFLSEDTIQGRPCDVLVAGGRDILFTDDHGGVVYRLSYEERTTPPAL